MQPNIICFTNKPFEYKMTLHENVLHIMAKHIDDCYTWAAIVEDTVKEPEVIKNGQQKKFIINVDPDEIFEIFSSYSRQELDDGITITFPNLYKNSKEHIIITIDFKLKYGKNYNDTKWIILEAENIAEDIIILQKVANLNNNMNRKIVEIENNVISVENDMKKEIDELNNNMKLMENNMKLMENNMKLMENNILTKIDSLDNKINKMEGNIYGMDIDIKKISNGVDKKLLEIVPIIINKIFEVTDGKYQQKMTKDNISNLINDLTKPLQESTKKCQVQIGNLEKEFTNMKTTKKLISDGADKKNSDDALMDFF